jgi:hypothetical protein
LLWSQGMIGDIEVHMMHFKYVAKVSISTVRSLPYNVSCSSSRSPQVPTQKNIITHAGSPGFK